MIEPWHDTVIHDGDCGPIVPVASHPNDLLRVAQVKCAACGCAWTETSMIKLARIWWSAGAYEGAVRAEELKNGGTK